MFTAQSQRDAERVAGAGLRSRVEELPELLREEPLRMPPRFGRLVADLMLRMWAHYE